MKSISSHSCYNIFEPEIPTTLTDVVKNRYEIYIIISLVFCTPDYDVMLSRNNIQLSIVQNEKGWTATAQSMHIHHNANSHTRICSNDHPVVQQIACLSSKSNSNTMFKRTQHLSLSCVCEESSQHPCIQSYFRFTFVLFSHIRRCIYWFHILKIFVLNACSVTIIP